MSEGRWMERIVKAGKCHMGAATNTEQEFGEVHALQRRKQDDENAHKKIKSLGRYARSFNSHANYF